jgi:hypothetical protein
VFDDPHSYLSYQKGNNRFNSDYEFINLEEVIMVNKEEYRLSP